MHYLVFGTGAVGGLMGGRLAVSGQPVTFLTRPRAAQLLRQQGLRLEGDGPAAEIPHPRLVEDLPHAFQGTDPPEVILLCVKAYDCEAAAGAIASAIPAEVPVVCLLNGIGNEETLSARLGPSRVIPAALTTAVLVSQPGVIHVERTRGLDLACGHPVLQQFINELGGARFRVRAHAEASAMKWSKLMTNIVANAASAIVGWPPAAVFAHPGLYRLEVEALREVLRVMHAMGLAPENLVGVPVGFLSRALFLPPRLMHGFLSRSVASGRGKKLPSFHYDIGTGRSEVRWLNGAVVEHGRRLGLPTPANSVLTDVMLGLVEGRLDPTHFRGHPDRLLAQASAAGVPGIRGIMPPPRRDE